MEKIFGNIEPPAALNTGKFEGGVEGGAIGAFLNIIIQILIVGASVYALFNLILAGYAFLAAGDDPKKIEGAWAKIWQTVIGLVVVAGAFVLAAIFGRLIFGDWTFILKPTIPSL